MKSTLGLAISLFCTMGAQALPVDLLKCRVSIAPKEDSVRLIADHKFDVSLIRYPEKTQEGVNYEVTTGRYSIDNEIEYGGYMIRYSLDLINAFAIRESKVKTTKSSWEAVQNFCTQPVLSVCRAESKDPDSCPILAYSCKFSEDPFDPIYGWDIARVDSQASPIFNQKTLGFPRFDNLVTEGGIILGTLITYCEYVGLIR